ncbi:hypothetical protein HanXRQr2_Chr12g0535041 [Helianthus annuus]|uniref:Uncharacterized protein n=1 Tax=Helianthus annuus TaxID=4232 RepID=A0A9K3HFK9_HELAN|nr:hypothetical protein HanXRQr2_Chr12g0535041 [Helianthus annuus]KAJ0492567.1 hypothetical protein HanIR_Chr12g0576351 [Helianthus annuus]KAJ0862201.1 hypothetical protein HanPSC8_Chr12g0515371 [Helianthus annuus]
MLRFTIPLTRKKKSALRAPLNKFIPAPPLKPATPPPLPPPPATTAMTTAAIAGTPELPARLEEKLTHLNQPRKGFIYRHNYRIVVVGEDNFSTSERLAREFGTGKKDWAANFWVTSPHPKGSNQENTSGA